MPATTTNPKAAPPHIGTNTNKRPRDIANQEVSVWDKDGVKHRMARHCANDLVRHCGWTATPPKKADADADAETEEVEVDETPKIDGISAPVAKEPDEIDLLREEALGLNISFDNRWGKKKLQEEIEKKKKSSA